MIYMYMITNPNGRVYIGQTKDPVKRKHNYKYLHCKGQHALHNSLIKYGWDAHVFEVIASVPIEYADDTEIAYIAHYKAYHTEGGLNLTRGGLRPLMSQETRDKLSQAIMGGNHYKAKKMYQYDSDMNLVKQWDSMRDIKRALGFNTSMLAQAAKGNGRAYGFIWSYIPRT